MSRCRRLSAERARIPLEAEASALAGIKGRPTTETAVQGCLELPASFVQTACDLPARPSPARTTNRCCPSRKCTARAEEKRRLCHLPTILLASTPVTGPNSTICNSSIHLGTCLRTTPCPETSETAWAGRFNPHRRE